MAYRALPADEQAEMAAFVELEALKEDDQVRRQNDSMKKSVEERKKQEAIALEAAEKKKSLWAKAPKTVAPVVRRGRR